MSDDITITAKGELQNPSPPHTGAITYRPDLSDREMASLEKVAILRGLCGKYRRALRDIVDFPERAADIAKRALGDQP